MTEMDDITKSAIDSLHRMNRSRMMAMSCVADALAAYGEIDPDDARQAAHDIATHATVTLLQRIYEGDAEIATLRIERDHYRKLVEKALLTAPARLFVRD